MIPRPVVLLLSALLGLAVLAGCGQSGDLYLPEPDVAATPSPVPSPPPDAPSTEPTAEPRS